MSMINSDATAQRPTTNVWTLRPTTEEKLKRHEFHQQQPGEPEIPLKTENWAQYSAGMNPRQMRDPGYNRVQYIEVDDRGRIVGDGQVKYWR